MNTSSCRLTLLQNADFPMESLTHPDQFGYKVTHVTPGHPAQHFSLPKLIKGLKADVYYNPFIDGPFFTPAEKNVFAIHDLNHYFFSPYAATERKLAILYAKLSINVMAKTYDKIIVFSNYVADQVIQHTLAKKEDIHTINHGFVRFSTNKDPLLPPLLSQDRYLLYVGNNRPHKNVKGMVDAFVLSNLGAKGYKLVLAGHQIKRFFDVENYILQNTISSIILIERPSNDELDSLYKNASAILYPSLSEGFGFPLLEAWNYDKPIACSNLSCLPEIGGDAALYFDAWNTNNMARSFNDIVFDKSLRDTLVENGSKRLSLFKWETSAEQHLKVFLE